MVKLRGSCCWVEQTKCLKNQTASCLNEPPLKNFWKEDILQTENRSPFSHTDVHPRMSAATSTLIMHNQKQPTNKHTNKKLTSIRVVCPRGVERAGGGKWAQQKVQSGPVHSLGSREGGHKFLEFLTRVLQLPIYLNIYIYYNRVIHQQLTETFFHYCRNFCCFFCFAYLFIYLFCLQSVHGVFFKWGIVCKLTRSFCFLITGQSRQWATRTVSAM